MIPITQTEPSNHTKPDSTDSRLIIVSNRLPVNISKTDTGFVYQESVGGVATGIAALETPINRIWFGWPGLDQDSLTPEDQGVIANELDRRGCFPVHLTRQHIDEFYSGFSNKTIWPLFHYFPEFVVFDETYWESYKTVNQLFCQTLLPHITETDTIWIQDYQLMLLPGMIRKHLPNAKIGFFLHIPFPSFELLRNLPWRDELLHGILGADLIGLHEYDYVRHFLSSVYRICGYEHNLSKLVFQNRLIRVDAFPMGIHYEKYASTSKPSLAQQELDPLANSKVRIILSVDRLDYTKGILNRLHAYSTFLETYPEYRESVSLLVVAVPSRTEVEQYALLREEIESAIGRINGTYGTLNWTPVVYLYRSMDFESLLATYHAADVALITPLRDGMNLVAKEFVASQADCDQQGILILSEMAGAACELSESIVINPHDNNAIVEAIKTALDMPQEERRRRNTLMQARLSRYTVQRWAQDFIHSLKSITEEGLSLTTRYFNPERQEKVFANYAQTSRRLFLLDYDGTLSPFAKLPELAAPDSELKTLLGDLCADPRNTVVVVSGRDCDTLQEWLSEFPLHIVAEHGAFRRLAGSPWEATEHQDTNWKEQIRPILERTVDRTPGSFVEEKNSTLVWHFRNSEPDLAKLRIQELKDALVMMATNLAIGVFEGNKIIEVKPISINKGDDIRFWLDRHDWDFVFCAGDDYTDEDMFTALGDDGISCKVGGGPSSAKFSLGSTSQIRNMLRHLANSR